MRAGPNVVGIWALPLAILVLAAAIFALDLGGAATRLSGLEYDSYQHFQPRTYESPLARSGYDVRVLDIDATAIARFGNWPWPSDTLERVTDILKKAGTPVIVYAFALDTSDPSSPQRFAAQLSPGPQNDAARNALNKMVSADESLAASFQGTKAVTGFLLQNQTGDDVAPAKAKIAFDGVSDAASFVPRFAYAARSLPLFEAASAGTGALNLATDPGGVLRNVALVSRIGDTVTPSLDAEVLRLASEKSALSVHGVAGNMPLLDAAARIAGISAGAFDVKTRRDGAMTIYFAQNTAQRRLVLSQLTGARSLKNTIVYIAPPGENMLTPGGYRSAGEIHAEALENMLLGEGLKESGGYLPQLVFLLVAGVALIVLLMRAGLIWAGAFTLVMVCAVQGFGWYLFSSAHQLIDSATPSTTLAVAFLGGAAARAVAIANARASLRRSFADMLPTAAIEKIARDPARLKLDGETRVVTCLSCGLRRYADLAQAFKDDPTDFTRMITTAMAPLIEAALDHGGTIGHLDGDSFMAYWNAPLDDGEHAIHACDAAQYMTLALASVNEQLSHERRFDGTAFAPNLDRPRHRRRIYGAGPHDLFGDRRLHHPCRFHPRAFGRLWTGYCGQRRHAQGGGAGLCFPRSRLYRGGGARRGREAVRHTGQSPGARLAEISRAGNIPRTHLPVFARAAMGKGARADRAGPKSFGRKPETLRSAYDAHRLVREKSARSRLGRRVPSDIEIAMQAPALKKRHVAAAVVGNALEFYDFTTYAYFALQIGRTFFPSHDPFVSLMATLVTFGAGFIMRPVGGVVIGRYADRVGRKPAMILSFAMMGGGVLALALTPSYASIGVAAPIIVVLIRLVQGFALGGDVGPTTAFMLEAAPPEKRGIYGSMQFASQGVATLLAGIAGVVLAHFLTAVQLDHFGWRIALALGVAVVPIGLAMRRTLPETLPAESEALMEPPKGHIGRIAVLGLLMIMGGTTGVYVLNYMATYAQNTLHLGASAGFASVLTFGIVSVIFPVIAGAVSDRKGRRPVMIWPRVAMTLAAYPAFVLITLWPGALSLIFATALLGLLNQATGAVALVAITEALPPRVRSTTMASIYAIGVAVFGGTTQPIIAGLMHVSGSSLAPAWWLTGTSLIALIATAMMPETAPVKIGDKAF
jgi:MHS family citrate/tricarballylate:H+ symporter-like MFS transporter